YPPLHPPPPSQIFTLSLHDALPISDLVFFDDVLPAQAVAVFLHHRKRQQQRPLGRFQSEVLDDFRRIDHRRHRAALISRAAAVRSEEHTSELQSPYDLVCRLLLEKK